MTRSKAQDKDAKKSPAPLETGGLLEPSANKELISTFETAINTPLDQLAPPDSQALVPMEQVKLILKRMADLFGLTEAVAFVAIALLFLKGAANKGAPSTMAVDVFGEDGERVTVQKYDLMSIHKAVTGNNFLRRLAETLAPKISSFAEAKNLQGDLAKAINNSLIAQGEPPLSAKEKAWANSFCQKSVELEKEAPRVAKYLAIDYQKRFSKKKVGDTKVANKQQNKNQKKQQEKGAAKQQQQKQQEQKAD